MKPQLLFYATALIACGPAFGQPAPAPATVPATVASPLNWHGINANVVDATALAGKMKQQLPEMNALRLNVNPPVDSNAADIIALVRQFTAQGIMVLVEDHSGISDNVAWYQTMAAAFRNEPLVSLGMPNEPTTDTATTTQQQIAIIKAIRGAGFTGWVSIQANHGWDKASVPGVVAAVGTAGYFYEQHSYYNGTDRYAPARLVEGAIADAANVGLPLVFGEFGNSIDGPTWNIYGDAMIMAVLAVNEGANGGKVRAGALFWEAVNWGEQPDSVFMDNSGMALTKTGSTMIQPWLYTPGKAAPTVTNATQAPVIAKFQTEVDTAQQQVDDTQQQINAMLQQAPPSTPASAPPQAEIPTTAASLPSQPIQSPQAPIAPTASLSLATVQAEIVQIQAEIAALEKQAGIQAAATPTAAPRSGGHHEDNDNDGDD